MGSSGPVTVEVVFSVDCYGQRGAWWAAAAAAAGAAACAGAGGTDAKCSGAGA